MNDLLKLARTFKQEHLDYETHWDGCESQHVECLVIKLADEIEKLRNASDLDGELISNMHDEAERLRALLREYADVVRLVREGKPVPLAYLEDRIREALGDE
jgi:(p)ppGpp synthase/HD superfamily hydrolase